MGGTAGQQQDLQGRKLITHPKRRLNGVVGFSSEGHQERVEQVQRHEHGKGEAGGGLDLFQHAGTPSVYLQDA